MQMPSKDDLYGMYQNLSSRVKQYVQNMTPLELKVAEATNSDPWGPHGTVMAEITRSLSSSENFKQVMGVLAKRLQDQGEDWRHVYKALLLMEYMCKHGPQRIVDELNSNLYIIEKLQRFDYKDKNGKDWGLNVRQRAKEIYSLITDSDKLRQERQKAKQNEAKYTGVTADEARMGKGFGNSSGFGSGDGGHKSFSSGWGQSSGSIASQGFGSDSAGFRSQKDYDSHDAGHQSLRMDDSDDDEDTKLATKKRIAALKEDAPSAGRRGSPLKGGRAQAESQSKGPKRLSQVQVDPSIAASLGKPKPAPSSATNIAVQSHPSDQSSLLLDTTPQAAPPSTQADDGWDAFVDNRPSANGTSQASGIDDLFGGPAAPSTLNFQEKANLQDPFAVLSSANQNSQALDPFGLSSTGTPKPSGHLPLALQRKAATDPFASISSVGSGPKSQPLNELRSTPAHQSQDPFASSNNTPAQTGMALGQDFFSQPQHLQSGPIAPQKSPASWDTGAQHGSDLLGQTSNSFAALSFAPNSHSPKVASSEIQALGGGIKMAPNLPQPNLPPAPAKKDPFAGLAGF